MMKQFYEKNYRQYFKSTINIDPATFLEPLADLLAPGTRILDIGCGSGRDLLWLRHRGFQATGFERSASLARLARQHAKCPVIEGDFRHYDFAQLRFEALTFVGSLVHEPRDTVPAIITSTCRALVVGGRLLITMKEGKGTLRAPDGREFILWSRDELAEIFKSRGLRVLDFSQQVSGLRPEDIWLGFVLQV